MAVEPPSNLALFVKGAEEDLAMGEILRHVKVSDRRIHQVNALHSSPATFQSLIVHGAKTEGSWNALHAYFQDDGGHTCGEAPLSV